MSRGSYSSSSRMRETAIASNTNRHKKRKKKNKMKTIIAIFVLVAIAVIVLSQTVFFDVEKIDVIGETIYTSSDIIKTSGILIGDNMFRLKLSQIEQKLDYSLPYISNVSVLRKLPNKIEISVEPATPVGAIEFENAYFLIDGNLKILETNVKVIPAGLPVIAGIETQECEAGRYLSNNEIEMLDILFSLTQAFEKYDLQKINKIDFTNLMDIKVYYDERIEILIGAPSDFDYKLKFASYLLSNDIDETERGTIDVRLNTAGQATFRPEKEVTSSSVVEEQSSSLENENEEEDVEETSD
ncbi:MAG: FtsQ-type POTRA domain-containing protein [Oscillospiraceae bacterium]|nr:FtsQ-type POTRA domain-containing protein [Oscillospiraceae bacterium]